MSQLPVILPVCFLTGCVASLLAGLWRRNLGYGVAVGAALMTVFLALWGLVTVYSQGTMRYHLGGWPPPFGIEYVLDLPAAFMLSVITVVALLALVYAHSSIEYEVPQKAPLFYPVALLFLAGITGIVVTGDLFNLFVFLEITSVSAYALLAIGRGPAPLAALRYLILGTIAGSFFFVGVGLIYFSTGTLNMADVMAHLVDLQESRVILASAALIFTGLGLKMALFPLHLWLPDAYTYAPSAVNALIAPVMTKAAAFAILRMFLSVFPLGYLTDVVPVGTALVGLGVAGVFVGGLGAVLQRDYARMLAYSTVGQLGLIAIGIGMATPLGFAVALLHTMNHAVMKACLFMVAGSTRLRTERTDVAGMAGLGWSMPVTMASFSVTALAMVGIPPLVGFFSKFYLVQAGINTGNWLVLPVVLLSSLLTVVYLFRVVNRAYLAERSEPVVLDRDLVHAGAGQASSHTRTSGEAPLGMLIPVVILAIASIGLGLANGPILVRVLEPGILASLGR